VLISDALDARAVANYSIATSTVTHEDSGSKHRGTRSESLVSRRKKRTLRGVLLDFVGLSQSIGQWLELNQVAAQVQRHRFGGMSGERRPCPRS
jgi:hypothetical protein